jgi:hypothetical protein
VTSLGLLQPLAILEEVWTDISMYFIDWLPPSQGKTTIPSCCGPTHKICSLLPTSTSLYDGYCKHYIHNTKFVEEVENPLNKSKEKTTMEQPNPENHYNENPEYKYMETYKSLLQILDFL